MDQPLFTAFRWYEQPEYGRKRKVGWSGEHTTFPADCSLLVQHWQSSEARPGLRPAIVPDSSCSLSGGKSFIHAMFFCYYHDPISFENCVFQLAERGKASGGAFKRNCPLEFNYACCWVRLKNMLCQEFLLMLHFLFFFSFFLPMRLQAGAIGPEMVDCQVKQWIKTGTLIHMETQRPAKKQVCRFCPNDCAASLWKVSKTEPILFLTWWANVTHI